MSLEYDGRLVKMVLLKSNGSNDKQRLESEIKDVQVIKALVFEGGGLKGIAHCGALLRLENFGLNITNVMCLAGTSAGSQIATILACGYTVDELKIIVMNMPVYEFMDNSCGMVRNVTRLFCSYGIFKGDYMEKYIDDLVADKLGKKNATFRDLFIKTNKTLRITGTCLSTSKLEYFDVNLTPDMPISKAVRISSSIPLFYSAVKYDNKYYVDGAVLRNLPVYAFPNVPTIFFKFKDNTISLNNERIENPKKYQEKNMDIKNDSKNETTRQNKLDTKSNKKKNNKHKINNLAKFLFSLIDVTVTYSNQLAIQNAKLSAHEVGTENIMIEIDTLDISGLDFDMDDDVKCVLLTQGEAAVVDALTHL
jgi:NTE family protein